MRRPGRRPFEPALGVDLVEIKKAREFYTRHKSRLVSFFHPEEIAFIGSQSSRVRGLAFLLAAKEAVFKASGRSWMGPHGFKSIRLAAMRRLKLDCVSHKDYVVVRCAGI